MHSFLLLLLLSTRQLSIKTNNGFRNNKNIVCESLNKIINKKVDNKKYADMKPSIAVYLQHYLTPSMTFIYRQLMVTSSNYQTYVLCSDMLANTDRFPFENIYHKQRNFIRIKKSRYFLKFYSWDKLLSEYPRLSIQQKKYFKSLLINKKIQLVHAQFGPAGIEILDIAKSLNIPLVVGFHGYDASKLLRLENYKKNLRKLFDYAKVIVVSDHMKNSLINIGAMEENIYVIRYGISTDFFSFNERKTIKDKLATDETLIFLQVSNFVEKKGHRYTLLAFKNYLEKYPNSKLILAGAGPLLNVLKNFCSELNISDKVEFLGLVDKNKVRELMSEADVFLHHSVTSREGDQEGIPNVIMEAMATGLIVISSNHSGIPELITNNVDGFLVNERDLEAYSRTLLNLPSIQNNVGIKARAKILEYYDYKIESEKLNSVYEANLKR